ncbi:hypothetical protein JAAARDRAFT_33411 [Jaapia argillacea MUCL 33604]|uniref:Uncharacterized protein n=1 Tax=Jaapia argillacea MUCL 33604 TaxID=933084 RepID=A0A067QB82_9AGAM|nr:hypothetical protein JAAARDRAFT_33411 [Jaapia argillacea MUCL 33604]
MILGAIILSPISPLSDENHLLTPRVASRLASPLSTIEAQYPSDSISPPRPPLRIDIPFLHTADRPSPRTSPFLSSHFRTFLLF